MSRYGLAASTAVRSSGFPTKLASSSGSSCRSWRTGRGDCDAADLAGCEDNRDDCCVDMVEMCSLVFGMCVVWVCVCGLYEKFFERGSFRSEVS